MSEDPEFVALLRRLKSSLEHQRRFVLSPQSWLNALAQTEGDIEEFLIDHGYQESEDREPLNPPTVTTVEWHVAGHSMVSPVHKWAAERPAREDYENLIARDSYLSGKQSGRIFRVTTIVDCMERTR